MEPKYIRNFHGEKMGVLDLILVEHATHTRLYLVDAMQIPEYKPTVIAWLKKYPALLARFKKGCGLFDKDCMISEACRELGIEIELADKPGHPAYGAYYKVKGEHPEEEDYLKDYI